MAPSAWSSKRSLGDDFIFTISDSDEDVPNYDAEVNVDEDALADGSDSSSKRKRADKQSRQVKKRKLQTNDDELGEDGQPGTTDTADDEIDQALNPEFEFEVGAQEGITIDAWDLGKTDTKKTSTVIGIDEIIARRRKRSVQDLEGLDPDGSNPRSEIHSTLETESKIEDEDEDELLANDGFGMGAGGSETEDEDEKSSSDAGEQSEAEEQDEEDDVEDDGAERSDTADEDDEDVAAPVPHPDDLIFDAEGSISPEPEENAEEVAKRKAFFAPEEVQTNSKQLTGTESSFQAMSLSRPILKGVAAIGFTQPTPIQMKTIPVALLGKDVVGGAVTGSGKTAAFIIPILERLLYRPKKVATTRVSILMPTRELAVQCFNVATKLATFTDITFALIVGGLSLREQEQTLKKRPDVIIATPGRFIDHMRNTASFAVENIEILVLDEADRMLEDGFADELNEVITTIPRKRQTMLFSATMTEDVDKLIRVGMTQPVRLLVDAKKQTVVGLTQEFIKIKTAKNVANTEHGSEKDESRRLAYLLHLVKHIYTAKTIVFLPTKALAHRVKVLFALHGIRAAELHGSMSQEQRLGAISSFRDGLSTHLLATDLASRGLDIPRVETVINYTVPPQTATYLHRVGRTARAGRTGVACTLFTSVKESKSAKSKSASERALLKPIMRVAKGQKALIRTRTLPADAIARLTDIVRQQQDEIEDVLNEEKQERLIAQTERDLTKSENIMKFGDEIASRPRRTWFQTEKEKDVAKQVGRAERTGDVDAPAKKHGKLSNKQKKALDARDERAKSGGWKKGKDERAGGGVLKSRADRSREKKKQQHSQREETGSEPRRGSSRGGRGRGRGGVKHSGRGR